MTRITLQDKTGPFAENKDIARDIRVKMILPALSEQEEVILDFEGIEGATQSFIHALISDIIRKKGPETLDRIVFKNCNGTVQKIISTVTEYMQESG
ncbi:MAG: STAS-like domain-containing protein [DPANN group archaeon]|nr:STAS-like domain-containing protein [DPANN group archaeon]